MLVSYYLMVCCAGNEKTAAQLKKVNGTKHIWSAQCHPASNGLAERFLQTFKHAMKASEREGKAQPFTYH